MLLDGHTGGDATGKVIEAFGQFVIGGTYAVGLVVFATRDHQLRGRHQRVPGRVSKRSARFTLDAMPGKQMAIDADLNAGLIDDRPRRYAPAQRDRREADFYGAMDGARSSCAAMPWRAS